MSRAIPGWKTKTAVVIAAAIALMCLTPPGGVSGTQEAQTFRLVVLGSSTAAGEAARPLDSSWVNRYGRYLATQFSAYEVVNLAVGGFTTFNVMPNGYVGPAPYNVTPYLVAANNNITKAISLSPSLIIVNLPTNDCDALVPVSQQLANFDAMIQAATNAGVPIWITTTQPRNIDSTRRALLMQTRDAIINRYGSRVIDFWTGLANADGTIMTIYNYDGTHLNNAGHAVLYDRVRSSVVLNSMLTLGPPSLDFGDRRVGTTPSLQLTISNSSGTPVNVDNISTGTARFAPDRTSGVVNGGSSMTVNVTFSPDVIGSYRDTLFVHNTSTNTLLRVPLFGNAPAPLLTATPPGLDFGDIGRGSSSQIQVNLANNGLNTGQITGISSATGMFSGTPGTATLNPSGSMQLTVTFAPVAFGTFVDTLRLTGTLAGGVFKFPVRGRAPVPVLTSSVTTLDFGDVTMSSPRTIQLTLGNNSISPLVIDALANSDSRFFVDPYSATIPGSGSLPVSVTFAPTSYGIVRDTIVVISNTGQPPLRIALQGNSPAPSFALSRSSIGFPMVVVGDSVTRTVTVRNLGANPLIIQSVSAKSLNFVSGTSMPANINGNDSLQVAIRFVPKTGGDFSDTVTVGTSVGAALVTVAGSSQISLLQWSPGAISFGNIKVGTQALRYCTVRMQNGTPGISVRVDSAVIQGGLFHVTGFSGPKVLQNSDSLTLAIVFQPQNYTAYSDTLRIYNTSALTILRIPVSGRGETFTGVQEPVAEIPSRFGLAQNYPNPFNPSTVVAFDLPEGSAVSLRVYDLVGREVAVLADGVLPAGMHQRTWQAQDAAAGTYFCRLLAVPQGGNGIPFVHTIKLVLLK